MTTHPIYRVTSVEVLTGHTLRVHFDDGLERTIDFLPALAGELYGPLRDPERFREVRVDPEIHTLVWPNGADFDPAMLHDWPAYAELLTERARNWSQSAA